MPAFLATVDSVRRRVLRAFAPLFGRFYGDRASRIAAVGALGVVVALLLSLRFPLALLALGPLLLGVPHLLADLRYLVVQPKAHGRPLLVLFVLLPLAATWYSPTLKVGLLSIIGAALIARTTLVRKIVGIIAAGTLYGLALCAPASFSIVFAHAHNYVAAIVLLCFSRSLRHALVPVALFLLVSILTVGGAFDAVLHAASDSALPGGANLDAAIWQYAPFCNTFTVAMRFVVLFVFAQSVHYTIWLRMLPDEARPRKGLRSFRSSFVALRNDVGLAVLVGFGTFGLMFVLWGLRSLEGARFGYLRIAAFHGYLELAFLMLLALEGRKRWLPERTATKGEAST